MIRHLYLLIFLFPFANGLRAQCTTNAGTLAGAPPNVCENAIFEAIHSGNFVLDTNDVLVYVVYTGANPQSGTVLATSTTGIFPYDPAFLDNSPVRVAAVAGNNNGSGGVDWTDPCLSVSPGLFVQFFPPPTVTATGGTLTCVSPTVQLSASANQGGVSFAWFGPGGFTSTVANPVVSFPGSYCVTATSVAGCTSSTCITVTTDAAIPTVVAPLPSGLSCQTGLAELTTWTQCNNCTFSWWGVGIVSGENTTTITVNAPGTYFLVVTDVENGCTNTAQGEVFPTPVFFDSEVIHASCSNISNGAINLNPPTEAVQPLTFSWTGPGGFTSTQEDLNNLAIGTYNVTITDATDCEYVSWVFVISQQSLSLPSAQQTITPAQCFGLNNGAINITPAGGLAPLTYSWIGPNSFTSNMQDITGLPAGTYIVTVTESTGCTLVSQPFQVSQPTAMVIDVGPVNCGDGTLYASISGGIPPYSFLWLDGNTTAVITDPIPGTYTVTITDANGCTAIGEYNYTGSTNNLCGYIEGRLVLDTTQNCVSDTLEPGLAGWIVKALDGSDTYYGVSNDSGFYKIPVEEGNYTLLVEAPNNQLWLVCTPSVVVGQVNPDDTVTVADVPVQEILECPLMEVSVSTNFLRRCFDNNFYYVNYCNIGTADAAGASIVVTLDPFLSIVNSEFAYTSLGNDQYLFELGDVAVGACDNFWFRVMVSCDAVLGQTHCVEVLADPAGECLPTDPFWSGASLSLHSECTTDSVYFIIKNTGIGNMSADAEYIVIEDAVMRAMGTDLRLDSGDSMRIAVPANGATWRVEVTQEPLHPGFSQPMLSVEGCSATGAFTTGFVSQFSSDDDDPWIDIECRANIGAYDPNDKQGFPIGYGAQRYIKPGTDIEYLIRFQNTGTDTAFNIYVLDTLSQWLDPATIRLGASSHPFVFDVYGNGILKFDFPNIMLPDSNVNEPLSNGFVQFRIAHREDAPLETVINNEAAIYFDFNEPIFTNTTEHRLGENFLSVSSWEVLRPGLKLDVAPNPSVDVARITVNGLKGGEDLRLRVCDLQGRTVREVVGTGGVFEIQRGAMPAGVYMLVLFVDGQAAGSGKMSVASH